MPTCRVCLSVVDSFENDTDMRYLVNIKDITTHRFTQTSATTNAFGDSLDAIVDIGSFSHYGDT